MKITIRKYYSPFAYEIHTKKKFDWWNIAKGLVFLIALYFVGSIVISLIK